MFFRPTFAALAQSQKAWISRQFRDPYVKKRLSDPAAYRARSAFKLLEIDAQWGNFLMKEDVNSVVDLGAAPGGWSQVVAGKLGWSEGSVSVGTENRAMPFATGEKVVKRGMAYGEGTKEKLEKWGTWSAPPTPAALAKQKKAEADSYDPVGISDVDSPDPGSARPQGRGTIIALDLLRMQPIPGVRTIQADFLSPETEIKIRSLLSAEGSPDGKVDVILSDMAANSSGNDLHDIESSLEICEAVFEFAKRNLRTARDIGRKRGGVLLIKHFTHPLLQRFRTEQLQPHFLDVKYIKPDSSRSASKEGYFLCQGWQGI